MNEDPQTWQQQQVAVFSEKPAACCSSFLGPKRREARPALAELKLAARDEDPAVSFRACIALLALIPLDEVIAAVPNSGQRQPDPLKGKVDQIISQLRARGPGAVRSLQQEAGVDYWLRAFKDRDPRVRFIAAVVCQLPPPLFEAVIKSILQDRRATPELKAFLQSALEDAPR